MPRTRAKTHGNYAQIHENKPFLGVNCRENQTLELEYPSSISIINIYIVLYNNIIANFLDIISRQQTVRQSIFKTPLLFGISPHITYNQLTSNTLHTKYRKSRNAWYLYFLIVNCQLSGFKRQTPQTSAFKHSQSVNQIRHFDNIHRHLRSPLISRPFIPFSLPA